MGEDILGDEGSSVQVCINVTTSLSFNKTLILSVSFIDSPLASKFISYLYLRMEGSMDRYACSQYRLFE